MERQIVATNDEIAHAIVFGSQNFRAGLLVEPADPSSVQTQADQVALIDRIWPSIAKANRQAPANTRIEKPFIILTSPAKPMVRSTSGGIMRAATIRQYDSEMEKVFANTDRQLHDDSPDHEPKDQNNNSVVRKAVESVTGWYALQDDDVLFDKGLDSLRALQITRALRRSLNRPTLSLSIVYKNPTIGQLSQALGSGNTQGGDLLSSLQSTYTDMIKSIPIPRREGPLKNVVLTGSTGYLGTYILYSLLCRSRVDHIFCLNRAEDGGKAVQLMRFATANLEVNGEFDNRITFLKSDLAHPKLGLDDETYRQVADNTGIIIHNAWPVNFILELQNFRPQLAGVVNLCSLAALAPRGVKFVFMSSVTAVLSTTRKFAPESIANKPPAGQQGYGRSKFIAEKLLDAAAKHLGIATVVARIGQIAGPIRRKGLWNPAEWLPSLICSSFHLECIPNNLGLMQEVDWIPSDVLGEIIVDIATSIKKPDGIGLGAQVFNLRNTHVIEWNALIPAVQRAAKELRDKDIEVVDPAAWLERLKRSLEKMNAGGQRLNLLATATLNPAIRLFDFFNYNIWAEGITPALMEVGSVDEVSPLLQTLPAVSPVWMGKWMEEWVETNNTFKIALGVD